MTPGLNDKTFRSGEHDGVRAGKLNLVLVAVRDFIGAVTAYAVTLLAAADAAAARTILGLGTMAVQNANAVAITGGAAAFTAASSLTGATTADSTFSFNYTGASGTGAGARVKFLTASVPGGAGHRIGTFNFVGYSTGTTEVTAASIIGKAIGAWSATDAGSYLQFNATPAGSVTTAEIARLTGGVGLSVEGSVKPKSYTVAGLPSAATHGVGSQVYASNGRKSGEGGGAGTGVPVWSDGTNWKTFYDNSTVAA